MLNQSAGAGTGEGAAYFVPFAKSLVERTFGWQVWSVERRENLLEDQTMLNKGKRGLASGEEVFNYYLAYLLDPSIEHHYKLIQGGATVGFAREWGMNVAVEDLHVAVEAAKALGGKVVLGGHSIGGSIVTAYATWDFAGKPGADGISGLVYDDGGSSPVPFSEEQAEAEPNASSKSRHGSRSTGFIFRIPGSSPRWAQPARSWTRKKPPGRRPSRSFRPA